MQHRWWNLRNNSIIMATPKKICIVMPYAFHISRCATFKQQPWDLGVPLWLWLVLVPRQRYFSLASPSGQGLPPFKINNKLCLIPENRRWEFSLGSSLGHNSGGHQNCSGIQTSCGFQALWSWSIYGPVSTKGTAQGSKIEDPWSWHGVETSTFLRWCCGST